MKPGTFPLAAGAVETWKTQDEIDNITAYLLGHAARNTRAALNIGADVCVLEIVRVRVQMARVFRKLREKTK